MRQRNSGISLLETIIASFIFLVTVMGLMGVWSTHSKAIGKARSILIANDLSERVMERCIAARFERVREFDGDTEDFNVKFIVNGQEILNTFTSTVEVTEFSDEILNVVVRVEWTDATGPRNIELHSQLHSSA